MSDLISRQAAIDALCEDYCYGHHDCKRYPKCENLRAIQKLPSAQPWIPCSERLPEHDGEKYLVTLYSDRINVVSVRISYCYMNRDGYWSDVPVGYKVTAWMPLPEPWKGESEETE